ncbi:MAG: hypothetical protein G01um101418_938 [Parcubacteria group bacterium Gr01-1014_18]|nr:MAG: hypothetical protein Greene041636_917 [Parcubacteria group bacterium Greene0416_36]TSC79774.1 MAG: hypothetical protein G01um101418_938 [Parcubacteria group bacterium Gr01-1014_18]TSC97976.1 MAG: hypothetical protein Greene101420_933 [Parcubacteria group bacterium Greene1014_20]TSD06605.1 MAG: hypothetical protein Greene07142_744 [Parcubacteria group bacterium Greene0714_2]
MIHKDKAKAKILVVEDDRFLSKVYSTKLTAGGYETLLAGDGEEGARRVAEDLPDLVLLDIVMPKKNGFDVLREVKSSSKTKDIPIIILSNLGQEDDVKKGMELGAVDYLVKTNLSIHDVVRKVQDYVVKSSLKK